MKTINVSLKTIQGLLRNRWLSQKPPAANTEAIEQFDQFQREVAPLIAEIVDDEEEAAQIITDVMDRVVFQTQTITFKDMGCPPESYDNHGYPTAYDLGDEVSGISPLLESIDTTEAITFLKELKMRVDRNQE